MLRLSLSVAAALSVLALRPAFACDDTSLRDAAFDLQRDLHQLCVIGQPGEPRTDALLGQLEGWLAQEGQDLNLDLVGLNVDDPDTPWQDYGIPSAPPSWPVVALSGRNRAERRAFIIAHWENKIGPADLVSLKGSPVRDAIRASVANHWGVFLYAPDDANDTATRTRITQFIATWSEAHPPGLKLVVLDRNNPQERLLLQFAGIRPDMPPWLGLVIGKGKLLAPPLVGADITDEGIAKKLEEVTASCTCIQQPNRIGLDIPMIWSKTEEDKIALIGAIGGPDDRAQADPEAQLAAMVEDEAQDLVSLALAVVGGLGLLVVGTVGFLLWRHPKLQPQLPPA